MLFLHAHEIVWSAVLFSLTSENPVIPCAMKQITTFFFFLLLYLPLSWTQSTELGVMGGVALYSGDLSENEFGLFFENLEPAFGFFGRFNLNRTVAIRLGFSHARVSEVNSEKSSRDYTRNFRSNISEFSLMGEINLFRIGRSGGVQLIPYVFGGAAVFNFRPETQFDGDWVELQPLGTEGQGLPGYEAPYQLTQLAVPMGAGLKLDMGSWALSFELGGRKLFTDYLDDISNTTVNYRDVLEGNGELAATISNPEVDVSSGEQNPAYRRGGPYDDWYYIGSVSLSFDINSGGGYGRRGSGKNIGCPTF